MSYQNNADSLDQKSDLETESTDISSPGQEPEVADISDSVESGESTPVPSENTSVSLDNTPDDAVMKLELEVVLNSVADCYPLIEVAIGELEAADGKVISSWGQFDHVFSAYSISQPVGFYETFQNGASITRPLFSGGEVYGAYRIGDGNFEPWYGERETNEGGEFKLGFSVPLLKDRNIDARRATLWNSQFQRRELTANVESRLLEFQRFATQAYWDWVAAGNAVRVQQALLDLAKQRVQQIDKRLEEGDLPKIAELDNDRFIAKRTSEVIKANRKFQQSAIKLSLFLRDQNCVPIIANTDRLPTFSISTAMLAETQVVADISQAIAIRPEVAELVAQRQQTCVDLSYAQNLMLPKFDVKGFAGQDVGTPASSKGDKSALEFQVGMYAEVPIQRREGIGKTQTAEAKLSQIEAKRQFLCEKITVEIQDAASAVNAAHQNIEQSQRNADLTQRSLELARVSFEAGDIDLIELNIYETSVADAQLQLISAQLEYVYYLAVYQTAISGTAF